MEAPLTWDCPYCEGEAEFIGYTYDDGAEYECPECGEVFIVPYEDWAPLADWDLGD